MLAALRVPRRYDRSGRVALIGEAARALRDGRLPNDEARLFLAGALLGWLEAGGDLARDFLQIVRPKSHLTIQRLWRQLEDERLQRLIPDEGAPRKGRAASARTSTRSTTP